MNKLRLLPLVAGIVVISSGRCAGGGRHQALFPLLDERSAEHDHTRHVCSEMGMLGGLMGRVAGHGPGRACSCNWCRRATPPVPEAGLTFRPAGHGPMLPLLVPERPAGADGTGRDGNRPGEMESPRDAC
jgi:hypothetical protein